MRDLPFSDDDQWREVENIRKQGRPALILGIITIWAVMIPYFVTFAFSFGGNSISAWVYVITQLIAITSFYAKYRLDSTIAAFILVISSSSLPILSTPFAGLAGFISHCISFMPVLASILASKRSGLLSMVFVACQVFAVVLFAHWQLFNIPPNIPPNVVVFFTWLRGCLICLVTISFLEYCTNAPVAWLQAVMHKQSAEISKTRREIDECDDVVVAFAHKLRAPLTIMTAVVDDIQPATQELPDRSEEFAHIQSASKGIANLTNNILDIAGLDSQAIGLDKEDFSLMSTLRSIEQIVGSTADKMGLDFSVRIAPDVPDTVHGDGARLSQCLLNVLNNSLAFTQRGSVTVDVSLTSPLRGHGQQYRHWVRFVIQDTGRGLSSAIGQRLFSKQRHCPDASSRVPRPALGLYLVKELATRLEGSFSVANRLYRGGVQAVFIVPLETTASAAAAELRLGGVILTPPKPEPRSASHSKVLVIMSVSKMHINHFVVQTLLRDSVHKIINVSSGAEAEQVYQMMLSNPPDVVLLDSYTLSASEISNTVSRLRKLERHMAVTSDISHRILCVVTTRADSEPLAHYGDADLVLTKPLTRRMLRIVLDEVAMPVSPPVHMRMAKLAAEAGYERQRQDKKDQRLSLVHNDSTVGSDGAEGEDTRFVTRSKWQRFCAVFEPLIMPPHLRTLQRWKYRAALVICGLLVPLASLVLYASTCLTETWLLVLLLTPLPIPVMMYLNKKVLLHLYLAIAMLVLMPITLWTNRFGFAALNFQLLLPPVFVTVAGGSLMLSVYTSLGFAVVAMMLCALFPSHSLLASQGADAVQFVDIGLAVHVGSAIVTYCYHLYMESLRYALRGELHKRVAAGKTELGELRERLHQSCDFRDSALYEYRIFLTTLVGVSESLEAVATTSPTLSREVHMLKTVSQVMFRDLEKIHHLRSDELFIQLQSSYPLRTAIRDTVTLLGRHARQRGVTLTAHIASSLPEAVASDPSEFPHVVFEIITTAIRNMEDGSASMEILLRKDLDWSDEVGAQMLQAQQLQQQQQQQQDHYISGGMMDISEHGFNDAAASWSTTAAAVDSPTARPVHLQVGFYETLDFVDYTHTVPSVRAVMPLVTKACKQLGGTALQFSPRGFTFTVKFEISPPRARLLAAVQEMSVTVQPLSILLVDSSNDIQTSMRLLLKDTQHHFQSSLSALTALETTRARSIDVVFIAESLADMNGVHLLQRLRHELPAKVALVMLQDAPNETLTETALNFGAWSCELKPVPRARLLEMLEAIAHGATSSSQESSQDGSRSSSLLSRTGGQQQGFTSSGGGDGITMGADIDS